MSSFYPIKNWYYVRLAYPLSAPPLGPILPGQTKKLYYTVGDATIHVLLREVQTINHECVIRVYSGPSGVSGGTVVPIRSWNYQAGPSVGSLTRDVTTTDDGTLVDEEYIFGPETGGPEASRQPVTTPPNRVRILPGSTNYLVTITNTGTVSMRLQYYLDWLEFPY